jgi:hypothetical protein
MIYAKWDGRFAAIRYLDCGNAGRGPGMENQDHFAPIGEEYAGFITSS